MTVPDPGYVDVTIRRYEALTDREALLAKSGKTFDQVASERPPASDETTEGGDDE